MMKLKTNKNLTKKPGKKNKKSKELGANWKKNMTNYNLRTKLKT
jgi:hypothetical protein